MTPEQLIDLQLKHYNNHDIEALVATFSPTAQFYHFKENILWFEGHTQIRELYFKFFQTHKPHVTILKRMVLGNHIIDEENVASHDNPNFIHAVAIYEVRDNLIQKVWMMKT